MTDTQEADEALVARAQDRLADHRECQLLAALIEQLRERGLPWWTPEQTARRWPTATRFRWLEARPDLRARLTHELTGLAPRAARLSEAPAQAELIDQVVQAGDRSIEDWEAAFEPEVLAVHAPPAAIWQAFREDFPWQGPEGPDRDLLVWLLGMLLEERRDPSGKTTSIMTPLYVRSAIDVRIWQEHMPLDIRVQVDGRRLRKELEGKTFTCRDELAVVKLDRIVENVPAVHLRGVLDALERVLPALGGAPDAVPAEDPTEDEGFEGIESETTVDQAEAPARDGDVDLL
ncbi:MAG: hypothetical protein R3F59_20175 [Myxococcota bacterium]